jgi:hypothetical protein
LHQRLVVAGFKDVLLDLLVSLLSPYPGILKEPVAFLAKGRRALTFDFDPKIDHMIFVVLAEAGTTTGCWAGFLTTYIV